MLEALIGIAVTALIWGITDPLMKKFGSQPIIQNWLTNLIPFLSNWKYTLTFVTNQLGSATFLWTLNRTHLSLAVPVTNSLKFLITFITGQALGEAKIKSRGFIGLTLVFIGVILQTLDHVWRQDHE